MKYESIITCHSKDMTNVKVFADKQTDGQAKNYMPPDLSIQGHKNSSNTSVRAEVSVHGPSCPQAEQPTGRVVPHSIPY
jgi:hypothetical protein